MRILLLADLDRQIREQREKFVEDQRRLESAIMGVPRRAAQLVASPPGLLVSFALGALMATKPRGGTIVPIVGWDVLKRIVIDEMPAVADWVVDQFRLHRRTRAQAGAQGESGV
jgi:hypothetical protein